MIATVTTVISLVWMISMYGLEIQLQIPYHEFYTIVSPLLQ